MTARAQPAVAPSVVTKVSVTSTLTLPVLDSVRRAGPLATTASLTTPAPEDLTLRPSTFAPLTVTVPGPDTLTSSVAFPCPRSCVTLSSSAPAGGGASAPELPGSFGVISNALAAVVDPAALVPVSWQE